MSQQVEERKVRFEPQMRRRGGDGRKLIHRGLAWASRGLRKTGCGILGRHASGELFEDLWGDVWAAFEDKHRAPVCARNRAITVIYIYNIILKTAFAKCLRMYIKSRSLRREASQAFADWHVSHKCLRGHILSSLVIRNPSFQKKRCSIGLQLSCRDQLRNCDRSKAIIAALNFNFDKGVDVSG